MKGYYECMTCHRQWMTLTFDTIPCPSCRNTGVARAIVGGAKPAWYAGSETPIDAIKNPSQVKP